MSKYTDEERVLIAKEQYNKNYELGYPVKIDDNKIIGYLSQIIDKPFGEDTYVITDTYVPETASFEERSQVKEVTILYQGSTESDDWALNNAPFGVMLLDELNIPKRFSKDVIEKIGLPTKNKKILQFTTSADTLKSVLQQYPNAQINVYGHSLGSMNAQYAIADLSVEDFNRINGAYLYQGPNVYTFLSSKNKKKLKIFNSQNKIYNYIDFKDIVARGYLTRNERIGQLIHVDSINCSDIKEQHNWGGYQFENGNLLTKNIEDSIINYIDTALIGRIAEKITMIMNNGGKLSSAEEIFLDATQALFLTEGFKRLIQEKIEILKVLYKNEIESAEDLWNQALTFGTTEEGMAALEEGGVTIFSILQNPKNDAETSLNKLENIEEKYNILIAKIKEAIKTIIEQNDQIASQLGIMK